LKGCFTSSLGYIGTSVSEGMKWRTIVLSDKRKLDANPHHQYIILF